MTDSDLLIRYNYARFIPELVEPWLRFDESPPLGHEAPDFPVWSLADGAETLFSRIWQRNLFTVVEFGSFT